MLFFEGERVPVQWVATLTMTAKEWVQYVQVCCCVVAMPAAAHRFADAVVTQKIYTMRLVLTSTWRIATAIKLLSTTNPEASRSSSHRAPRALLAGAL